MKPKITLLIDNSNSRTKFCLYGAGGIVSEIRMIATSDISEIRLSELLEGWQYDAAAMCSVVPAASAAIVASLKCPVRCLGVSDASVYVDFSSYSGRGTLGADRVANAVGLAEKGIFPAVAIDLGTAITFEVIVSEGADKPVFYGGVIAPGFSSLRSALNRNTALLPKLDFDEAVPAIGKDTCQSMQAGVGLACRGMIREILDSIQSHFNKRLYVVAVGGDAPWIQGQLDRIDEVDTMLTFQGMVRMLQSES